MYSMYFNVKVMNETTYLTCKSRNLVNFSAIVTAISTSAIFYIAKSFSKFSNFSATES